ncbi:MAG: GNAT family N-acetyltransferase [bacterium]
MGDPNDIIILDGIARRVANELHAIGVDQWSATYPSIREFTADIARSGLYIDEEAGRIVGSISVLPENDPAYAAVVWKGRKAFVVHRLMVDPDARLQGTGSALLEFAIGLAMDAGMDAVKVDTHPDNQRMRRLLVKHGFIPRGYLPSINRDAYERLLK